MNKILLLLALIFSCFATTEAQFKLTKEQKIALRKGVKLFEGTFDNAKQAAEENSPLYAHQVIRGKRIKFKSKTEKWIHFAWFHPDNDQQPLDQRIFQFQAQEDGSILVYSYYVPNKDAQLEGSWELDVEKIELTALEQDVCSCRFIPTGDGFVYKFVTSEPYCQSKNEKMPYAQVSLDFVISKEQFSMFNNFYNEDGDVLFGFSSGSHFERE